MVKGELLQFSPPTRSRCGLSGFHETPIESFSITQNNKQKIPQTYQSLQKQRQTKHPKIGYNTNPYKIRMIVEGKIKFLIIR